MTSVRNNHDRDGRIRKALVSTRREWLERAAGLAAGAALTPAVLAGCGERTDGGSADGSASNGAARASVARGGEVDVRDYGATAEGDFRTALQAAVEAAVSGSGAGVVRVPEGTWTFRSVDERGRFVTVRGLVTIRGVPGSTVLTAADGLLEWDGFRADTAATLELEDLIFDGNAEGNRIPRGGRQLQSWVYLDVCERLAVRRVRFRNHAGARCISVGNGVVAERTAGSVEITDVGAHNVGSAAPGNDDLGDHSTFWINAATCLIARCSVTNDRMGRNDTFIENHSSSSLVTGNTIRNVRLGIIPAALFNDQVDSVYQDNEMGDVRSAYRFYVQNGQRLNVTVRGDRVVQSGDLYPIFDTAYCSDPAELIHFDAVEAENGEARPSGSASPGFAVGRVRSLVITRGVLRRVAGAALTLDAYMPIVAGETALAVRGMQALDCCRGRGAPREIIRLAPPSASATLRACVIEDNVFDSAAAEGSARVAIGGAIRVEGETLVQGNRCRGLDAGCGWVAGGRG